LILSNSAASRLQLDFMLIDVDAGNGAVAGLTPNRPEATATVGQAAVAVKDTVTFSLPMINASRQVGALAPGGAETVRTVGCGSRE
jgi:hypothetical protein